ncbi:hypothetical protein HED49_20180 [Ochrobactrum daejeonense]|nr:hypothetical protein [Brucella daejeonensis]
MQVYNRVLVSESIPTLVLLTVILVVALLVMAILDAVRSQIMIRCGILLDEKLAGRVFSALVQRSSKRAIRWARSPCANWTSSAPSSRAPAYSLHSICRGFRFILCCFM